MGGWERWVWTIPVFGSCREESWNRHEKATRSIAELFHLTPESQSRALAGPWKFWEAPIFRVAQG